MQEEVKWRQQMLSQSDKLLQSLRVELKVYEQLEEERRKQPGTRRSAQGPCREAGSPGRGQGCTLLPETLPSWEELVGHEESSS